MEQKRHVELLIGDARYLFACNTTQIQSALAILNGEPEPKVEGPWRVTEQFNDDDQPRLIWRVVSASRPCAHAILYESDGWIFGDAQLLADRRNAREAQAKPRYEARPIRINSCEWTIYDSKENFNLIEYAPHHPGGPEAAARAEAARLNAAEVGRG